MKVLKVSKAEFAELKMRLKQRDKDGHDSLQLPPTLLTALQRTTGGHSTPNARPMNIAKVQIVRTDKALMSHADGSVTVKRAAVSPLANCSKRVTSADAHSVMQLRQDNRLVAMPGIQSPLASDTGALSTSFLPTPPRTVQTVCSAVVTPTHQVLYAAKCLTQIPIGGDACQELVNIPVDCPSCHRAFGGILVG